MRALRRQVEVLRKERLDGAEEVELAHSNPSPSPSPSPSANPNPNPAEAYVREAVILLGLPAAPGDDDLVGLSVLEGRVVDQQGNVMAGGPPAWTNLKPESPEGPGCPWLG